MKLFSVTEQLSHSGSKSIGFVATKSSSRPPTSEHVAVATMMAGDAAVGDGDGRGVVGDDDSEDDDGSGRHYDNVEPTEKPLLPNLVKPTRVTFDARGARGTTVSWSATMRTPHNYSALAVFASLSCESGVACFTLLRMASFQ